MTKFPQIIQGGMGAGVSGWRLAKAVSQEGQLGVVAGTALNAMLARRLQMGDPEGHMRRALSHFPVPEIAKKIVETYLLAEGKSENDAFKTVPFVNLPPTKDVIALLIAANFVEVFLAKEGHSGLVGINFLEKVQLPNLFSIYGAMLAGVDCIIMGAGIPREVPGALDRFARQEPASFKITVKGADNTDVFETRFEPQSFFSQKLPPLKRPKFFPIVSSFVLAKRLAQKATGVVDGFVIETAYAGGHNAPPRGKMCLNEKGEPIYSEKDQVDLAQFATLEKPFWMAGAYGVPEKLQYALKHHAAGVQVGTAFVFCNESDMHESIKEKVFSLAVQDRIEVLTDPKASPTGFPFKVVQLEGTVSEKHIYLNRPRRCDLGFLRTLYKKEGGGIGYRCAAEPVVDFVKKGGDPNEAEGRKCICNGLVASIGLGQRKPDGYDEPPIVTAGDDLVFLKRYFQNDDPHYSAKQLIEYLLGTRA